GNILRAELKNLDTAAHTATLRIPEMEADLTCEYDGAFADKVSSMVIGRNEIGVSQAKPNFEENVLRGQVIAREYRGAVTDNKIRIGNCEIIAATHKFGDDSEMGEEDAIYVHVPPLAIRPIAG